MQWLASGPGIYYVDRKPVRAAKALILVKSGRKPGNAELSIPNIITLGRIILVPFIVWAIASDKMEIAFVIFIVAGISDAALRAGGAQATASTKTSSTAFDPCALLTKQDAAAAVGEAVGEPKPLVRSAGPGTSVAHCEYESAAGHSVQVTVCQSGARIRRRQ